MKNKDRQLYIISIILIILLSLSCSKEQPFIPAVWEGTITIETKLIGKKMFIGEQITSSVINVRLKERRRISIQNDKKKEIGFIIVLEDDGSTWHIDTAGTMTQQSTDTYSLHNTINVIINDTVPDTLSGWLYISTEKDNPFGNILPRGSYCLLGSINRNNAIQYITTTKTKAGTQSKINTQNFIKDFKIGSINALEKIGDHHGTSTENTVTSQSSITNFLLRSHQTLSQIKQQQFSTNKIISYKKLSLEDGKMTGTITGPLPDVGMFQGEASISWELD